MPMSISTASTRPTEHTKDVDKAEDKALAYIEEIVIGIHTMKDIHTEEDTREAKKIEDSDKRNATSVINKAADQQSTSLKNAREHTKGFANKLYTQQSKMLSPNSTAASLSSTKNLKELTILLLSPNLIQSSLC
jgi:cobalamin-dependent methionine synthase I